VLSRYRPCRSFADAARVRSGRKPTGDEWPGPLGGVRGVLVQRANKIIIQHLGPGRMLGPSDESSAS